MVVDRYVKMARLGYHGPYVALQDIVKSEPEETLYFEVLFQVDIEKRSATKALVRYRGSKVLFVQTDEGPRQVFPGSTLPVWDLHQLQQDLPPHFVVYNNDGRVAVESCLKPLYLSS